MMPALARTDTNASASSMESCSSYASEEGVPEIAHVEVRVLRSRRNRGPNGNPNPSLRIESASSAPSSLSAPYQHHPSEGASSHHTIRPTAVRPDSIVDRPHTFAVQSDASYRRDKLERLRRRLGDGVPVNMVFPSETDLVHAQDVDSNEQNRSGARRRRALWF